MDFFFSVLRFFKDGGTFMYPIGVVLLIGLVVAIERWIYLSYAKQSNRRAFNQILPLLKKRDYSAIVKMGQSSGAPVSRMVAAGVIRMNESPRRDDIELAMEEGVLEAMPRLEKRTGYLATLANIATLLGLLGTIIGLIAAFTAVANADPTEKASLLSSSISVAMNTTAFGLISAIPLLLAHALLQTKTTEIIDSLEMAGVKCLNVLAGGGSAKTRMGDSGAKVDH
ncbi:MotA/TolQ/ExbB proton channel family protein [Halioxenophilus sp. WMMB6]|uniref:MotA/TolQ/ExbB proton channel family protein n=1 Tax=Halioxenophilus sp. WMMB6 TaxID=3073815 RepID=UPI00295E3425|nr:MotA/TolQ/ExbB proton channel family protein [Halioxenophilus sp. WMMB6]